MAISIALTPMVAGKIGYELTALIYGLLALAVMMYCFWGCRETEAIPEESEKPKFFAGIIALVTNPRFWIFGFAGAFFFIRVSIDTPKISESFINAFLSGKVRPFSHWLTAVW
jgi:GPH family glycoside/pentoside/hexuronide:cation symporter